MMAVCSKLRPVGIRIVLDGAAIAVAVVHLIRRVGEDEVDAVGRHLMAAPRRNLLKLRGTDRTLHDVLLGDFNSTPITPAYHRLTDPKDLGPRRCDVSRPGTLWR